MNDAVGFDRVQAKSKFPSLNGTARPRKLMFDCPQHSLVTGKPIHGNTILRLSCGCEFVAVTGIGWLPNAGDKV